MCSSEAALGAAYVRVECNDGMVRCIAATSVKGAIRHYLVDQNGKERIVHLAIEDWWVCDRENWALVKPSIYCIDAWEDTEILQISRPGALRLAEISPAFNEMLRVLDERNIIATQRRLTSAISYSAEKRYLDFIKCYPDFLVRFPQHLIASYLGINKDTVSRLRKQNNKK